MRDIPFQDYKKIVEVLPVLCVDVVVRNKKGKYLLIKRANEPLNGRWWVIGGRVFKGETLEQAAIRKVAEETGLKVNAVKPVGYFEGIFKRNPFGAAGILHGVSVVFLALIDMTVNLKLDSQSSNWKYAWKLPEGFNVKSFTKMDETADIQP